jgi:hypothetical protein
MGISAKLSYKNLGALPQTPLKGRGPLRIPSDTRLIKIKYTSKKEKFIVLSKTIS